MRSTVLALTLATALLASARADDPTEPKYADKPASWWVEEYVDGDDSEVARAVLRGMGDDAVPHAVALRGQAERSSRH